MSLWAPLDPSHFDSVQEQQQYMQLRKWLITSCGVLLAKAAPGIQANLQECKTLKCTESSCRRYRGALLFTAKTACPTSQPENDIAIECLSLLDLARFRRLKLLQAALQVDVAKHLCIVVLIPADILQQFMKPECVPSEIGVLGVGSVALADLGPGLVRVCFQEIKPQLPDDVTSIQPDMLTLDPTDPSKLPPVHITYSLDNSRHGTLPLMPWGEPNNVNADDAMLTDSPLGALEPSAKLQEEQSDEASQPAVGLLSTAQQRLLLQQTINKFWLTVSCMQQRLTNRVRKIRCRERLGCDGIQCQHCRGAMVFRVCALERPGQAWRYQYQGQEFDSSTPKQYIRGVWHTAYDLVNTWGSTDVQLFRTILTHSRRQGYVQAVHVPRDLVTSFLPHVPPAGLLFWRLCRHPDIPSGPPSMCGTPPATVRSSFTGKEPSAVPSVLSAIMEGPAPAASEAMPSVASARSSEQGLPAAQPVPPPPPAPRRCAALGCEVCEERYSGVQLLVCSRCKTAAYCTADHQAADWKSHCRQCCAVQQPVVAPEL